MSLRMSGLLVGFLLLILGCSSLSGLRDSGCTPREELLSQELAKSELLRLAPTGAKDFDDYVTRPCDDDDYVGQVGTGFNFSGSAEVLRDFYRAELPSRGWKLEGENPPFDPSKGLDLGGPELCFENTAFPGVVLGIDTASPVIKLPPANLPPGLSEETSKELGEEKLPSRTNFLEFRFNEQGRRCADYVN